jgi:uncharacterized protein YegL
VTDMFGGDEGGRILIYLALDVSGSMDGAPLDAVQDGVRFLQRELKKVPEAVELAHICVVTFGTRAKVVTPLTSITSFSAPTLAIDGSTNMAAAIKTIGEQIDKDFVPTLEGKQRGDYRPLVFVLTDGAPDNMDAAKRESKALLNRKSGYGVGTYLLLGCGQGADENKLAEIAKPGGERTGQYAMMSNMTPENIQSFFVWLTASLVKVTKKASQAALNDGSGGENNRETAEAIPKDANGNQAFEFGF